MFRPAIAVATLAVSALLLSGCATAFQNRPAPKVWAAEAAKLPVLSDKVPSQEVVLEAQPDFVYAGWESNFSTDGAGTRADLTGLGIRSYVSPSACKEAGYKPAKLHFSDIDAENNQVANMFGVDDSALIAEQHATLKHVTKDTRGLSLTSDPRPGGRGNSTGRFCSSPNRRSELTPVATLGPKPLLPAVIAVPGNALGSTSAPPIATAPIATAPITKDATMRRGRPARSRPR